MIDFHDLTEAVGILAFGVIIYSATVRVFGDRRRRLRGLIIGLVFGILALGLARARIQVGPGVYFAHWITPEEQPLRFDTRFFAAPAPAGQEASGDDFEMTDLKWLTPREAVEAQERGEISLRNPTVKNLLLFDGAHDTAHALDRLKDREVTTIRPRVVGEGDQRHVLMPGDPGYF